MNKQDEQLANEAVKEASPVQNISTAHSLTVAPVNTALAGPTQTVPIEGLTDLPMSMVALPYVKLVQKSSSKTILASGKDATPGLWYLTDTKEQREALDIVILRAKVQDRAFIQDGQTKLVTQLYSLCIDANFEDLYVMILPVTSFSNWGHLIAMMKKQKSRSAWEWMVRATSEKRENTKGTFFVANFQLTDKITTDDIAVMQQKFMEYGGVLNKREVYEEDPTE